MYELIQSGGWLMVPIVICSIVATGIILERLWMLRASRVAPSNQVRRVIGWLKSGPLTHAQLNELREASPLGTIIAAGLSQSKHGRKIMKGSIEDAASTVVHELEQHLNTLGTIAAIAPLLGLLGTVIGMIDVFTVIMLQGSGNVSVLAGGISKALITTASGLSVAIPTVIFHRFFVRSVDDLVIRMEKDSVYLVDIVQGDVTVKPAESS